MVVHELLEPGRDRRQSAARVDEDRDVALGCEREHGDEPLVLGQELLRARMELDPAGAEVEATRGFLHWPFVEVEPNERNQASV